MKMQWLQSGLKIAENYCGLQNFKSKDSLSYIQPSVSNYWRNHSWVDQGCSFEIESGAWSLSDARRRTVLDRFNGRIPDKREKPINLYWSSGLRVKWEKMWWIQLKLFIHGYKHWLKSSLPVMSNSFGSFIGSFRIEGRQSVTVIMTQSWNGHITVEIASDFANFAFFTFSCAQLTLL